MAQLTTPAGRTLDSSALRFRFARSGGPGGQHVNTSSTKVTLQFSIADCGLPEPDRAKLVAHFGPVIQFTESQSRSQLRNRKVVLERLLEAVDATLTSSQQRRKTRATKGSVERRLADKAKHSQRKAQRRWRGDD